MKNLGQRFATIVLLTLIIGGCANDATSSAAAPAIPNSPDGTVVALAESLATYHPEILWEALPESYQSDINEITVTVAEKMDPEVYDRAMALVGRAIEVLQEKQDLILASNSLASVPADPAKVEMGLTSSLAVIKIVLASDVSTLAGLGAIDWEQFLGTTGSEVLELADSFEAEEGDDPFAEIESLTVETISATDETATLRVSTANHEPEEVYLVRVEGRWVPTEMAEDWDSNMAEARAHLETLTPEKMAELKGQAAFGLAMAEGIVEQVAVIETVEEFDAMVGPMLDSLMRNFVKAVPPQSYEEEDPTE